MTIKNMRVEKEIKNLSAKIIIYILSGCLASFCGLCKTCSAVFSDEYPYSFSDSTKDGSDKENANWILDIDKDRIDCTSLNNAVVTVTDVTETTKYNFTCEEGLVVKDDKIIIPQPVNIDYRREILYNIKVTGLKRINGEDISINKTFSVYNPSKEIRKCDITSKKYKIDYKNKIIERVNPGTTVLRFIKSLNFRPSYIVVVRNSSKKILGTKTPLSTGCTVEFFKNKELKYKFYISVIGDVTGGGRITKKGIKLLTKYLLGKITLKQPFLSSADMNGDGKVDSADLTIMEKNMLYIY